MKTSNNLRTYDPDSPEFKRVLRRLEYNEILSTCKKYNLYFFRINKFGFIFCSAEMDRGTQVKVVMDLGGGYEALFKPYR